MRPVPRELCSEFRVAQTSPDFIPFTLRRLPPQSTRHGGGDATGLTDKVARSILSALFSGAYRATAARYAGIRPEQLSRWLHRKGEPYETFQRWVAEAEAAFELRAVTAVTSSFHERPELALEMLSRKFPERWAKPNPEQAAVNVNFSVTNALAEIERRRPRAALFSTPAPVVRS